MNRFQYFRIFRVLLASILVAWRGASADSVGSESSLPEGTKPPPKPKKKAKVTTDAG